MPSEELTGQHKALADTLNDQFTNRMDAIEAKAEKDSGIILDLKEGVEKMTEKMKSTAHHGAAYVDGADDAFSTDDPAKRFSLARAICGSMTGWSYANTPYAKDANQALWPERDICEAATQKAQSSGVDTEGGFAVPEQSNAEYIPILLAKSIAAKLGVDFRTGFVGSPWTQPRVDAASQAYWVAENTAPTESDTELGQISMTPHDLSALIPVSNRLLFQTSGAFERFLTDHMSKIHALELDRVIFKGTGAAGEPLGLDNIPGIGTFNWTAVAEEKGDLATWQNITDKLSGIIETMDTANALDGSLAFAMNTVSAGYFREVKNADAMPLLKSGDPNDPLAKSLYGFPVQTSTQLASTDLYFGNWGDLTVGQWGTMVIDSSNVAGNAFFNRQTWLRANITVDLAVMHEASFVLASNFNGAT